MVDSMIFSEPKISQTWKFHQCRHFQRVLQAIFTPVQNSSKFQTDTQKKLRTTTQKASAGKINWATAKRTSDVSTW